MRLAALLCLPLALLAPTACGASRRAEPALRAVDQRVPLTGYERAQFGAGWVDVDHDGCDTREDILPLPTD